MESERGVWIGAAVATVALGAAVYYFYIRDAAPSAPAEQAQPASPERPQEPPPIRNPVPAPETEATAPLPPLSQSDSAVRESLNGVVGDDAVEELLVPDSIVRKFVITVDNLARRKAPVQSRPVAATPGDFRVAGTPDDPTLDPENYARYSRAVSLFAKADTSELSALYRRFYPLLQEAYGDLSPEGAYFNDRVIEVIDHLLATPQVPGPIELVRPKVYYEFKDPQLEALSAGQKLLIRMGPQNAGVVKKKLQEIRAELAADDSDD